ncbi:MAG: MBL fold metallo-hydrolase [Desulfobacterales bacterium]|nr:MBL fold metallo-hydrolase [Desulfobacterales bacterium]
MAISKYNNIHLFDAKMMGLDEFCGIFIIESNKNVLIDTGTKDCSNDLIEYLKSNNLFPHYIIITHAHHDHIGSLSAIIDEFGKQEQLTIICSDEGRNRLKNPNEANKYFTNLILDPIENVTVMNDGDIINIGDAKLQILYTPGHSDDSISIYDTISKTLFPGDLMGDWLWGKTYLSPHITPDFSEEKYFQSIKKVLSLDLKCTAMPHYGFFTGHNAYAIIKELKEKYNVWKTRLVAEWKKRKSKNDIIPVLKEFFKDSKFEAMEGYDVVIDALGDWCIMGYKNSGIFA